MAGIMATCADANAKTKVKAKKQPVVKDFAGLSDNLIALENTYATNGFEYYANRVEEVAATYFQGNKSLSKKEKTRQVLNALAKYADDTFANGSTADMMTCNYLYTAINHYKTALNYMIMQAKTKVPVVVIVTQEIKAWKNLEETLSELYSSYIYLKNEGGSLSYIFISGFAWHIAEVRYNDTEALLKAGFARKSNDLTNGEDIYTKANEAVNSFTSKVDELLNSDSYLKEDPSNAKMYEGLTILCKNLQTDMDAWIKARTSLVSCLDDQLIGINETLKLLSQIKTIGTPEQ